MSGDLIPFDYSGRQVRTVLIGGEPWFVAADVCAVLGYSHTASALRMLRDNEKGVHPTHTPGGQQDLTVISEPGLYRLIMRSNRPEAEPFQDWVSGEVLPSIRKTGSYAPNREEIAAAVSKRDLAVMVIEESDRADRAEAKIRELAPKAEYVDAYVNATEDATILRVVAKQLQVREQTLRQLLRDKKIVSRRIVGTRWSNSQRRLVTEYEWTAHAGFEAWFVQRDQPDAPRMHNGQMRTTLYVTPVGKVKLAELIARESEAS